MDNNLSTIYDYIAAFKAEPQQDLDAYYSRLDMMEVKFRQCLNECIISNNNKAVSMCEDDLEEVVSMYKSRWKPRSAKEEKYALQCKFALGKAKDALAYLKKVKAKYLGATSTEMVKSVVTETVSAGNKAAEVLSGTNGLAEYLGCSHNKAFDIIKSRILPNSVQYQTGRVWKFNRKRLDAFLEEHPEALGRVRQGGLID